MQACLQRGATWWRRRGTAKVPEDRSALRCFTAQGGVHVCARPLTVCTAMPPLPYACRTENERNRRRDLVGALRTRREQMLQALKRDAAAAPRAARGALLGNGGAAAAAGAAGGGRETDTTAELNNAGLLQMQQQVMAQQDQDLLSLERTVVGTKVRCSANKLAESTVALV